MYLDDLGWSLARVGQHLGVPVRGECRAFPPCWPSSVSAAFPSETPTGARVSKLVIVDDPVGCGIVNSIKLRRGCRSFRLSP